VAEPAQFSEVVRAEGHLIDSQLLNVIFDTVVKREASFDVLKFTIGRTNEDPSKISMRVTAKTEAGLQALLEELSALGCRLAQDHNVVVRPAEQDRCVPDDFYSTTNYRTRVRHGGRWLDVERQRMDAVIVIEGGRAICRKLREVRAGDQIVCGLEGIRVTPEFRDRDRDGFAFMTNEVSSERRVEASVARIAALVREITAAGGRIGVVAGPVVVTTGGGEFLAALVRQGIVAVVVGGNAFAVYDVEQALFGTAMGVNVRSGEPDPAGRRRYLEARNAVCRAGGLKQAVETGLLTTGVMYECIARGAEIVLTGSIRDEGLLPDTVADLIEAQDRYAAALGGVQMVLVLATMLHGIGVGNMLPSAVRMVCVDINPAVVTKLSDRGSAQTVGVVTDVGPFLRRLAGALAPPASP
jgi:lysine-ketoglutarate reductase/saccharopine dehydrogenase-like protein (TIGR00300 family)